LYPNASGVYFQGPTDGSPSRCPNDPGLEASDDGTSRSVPGSGQSWIYRIAKEPKKPRVATTYGRTTHCGTATAGDA
jgi:hypothetical protein